VSSLSVVIVTHDSRSELARSLGPLVGQLADGDELIVVDNSSTDGTAELVPEAAPQARLIETGANLGFGAACNLGAEVATGELLCFLNPDAVPAPGWREAIERPLTQEQGWAAWQGLVTADGGEVINTRGGEVHFTGIAWAGGAGEPAAASQNPDREPGFVSGACLALTRPTFHEAGGFSPEFFLYHEDVDLSLRLRLAGGTLGVEPAARVDHAYEFAKGPGKWRQLERNRWATLIRTYPGALLALLAPALAITELALVPISAAAGWLPQTLGAWVDTLRSLPRLLDERRAIQSRASAGAPAFAAALTPRLDSPYLGRLAGSRALNALLGLYWRGVLGLLRGMG
jgi:GT2 family glycosyltransferase